MDWVEATRTARLTSGVISIQGMRCSCYESTFNRIAETMLRSLSFSTFPPKMPSIAPLQRSISSWRSKPKWQAIKRYSLERLLQNTPTSSVFQRQPVTSGWLGQHLHKERGNNSSLSRTRNDGQRSLPRSFLPARCMTRTAPDRNLFV